MSLAIRQPRSRVPRPRNKHLPPSSSIYLLNQHTFVHLCFNLSLPPPISQAIAGAYAGWDPARSYAGVGWLMADLGVYRRAARASNHGVSVQLRRTLGPRASIREEIHPYPCTSLSSQNSDICRYRLRSSIRCVRVLPQPQAASMVTCHSPATHLLHP
jgi:hypothetical protein